MKKFELKKILDTFEELKRENNILKFKLSFFEKSDSSIIDTPQSLLTTKTSTSIIDTPRSLLSTKTTNSIFDTPQSSFKTSSSKQVLTYKKNVCKVPGCSGLGNTNLKFKKHFTVYSCPIYKRLLTPKYFSKETLFIITNRKNEKNKSFFDYKDSFFHINNLKNLSKNVDLL